MNPLLLEALDRIVAHFEPDPRCVALFLHGSVGRNATDAYSDVDLTLVVQDERYGEIRDGLRSRCEDLCGPILVWLPEGETEQHCNYAFLFRAPGGQVLLLDFGIVSASAFEPGGAHTGRALFDHEQLLRPAKPAPEAKPLSPDELRHLIDHYWVYAYLNGKYHRRGDVFKRLYVQQILLPAHLQVLRARYPQMTGHWWADDAKHLNPSDRERLLVYFCAPDLDALCAALAAEITEFSADARAACEDLGVAYPAGLEEAVRGHLLEMGALGQRGT